MGVRRYFSTGGQRRQFSYPFQVADDAMEMDVNKTLYPYCTTKETPHVAATVTKMRFVGSNGQVYSDNLNSRAICKFSKQVTLIL